MTKRDIYGEISIGKLQQGYIFTQAVSDDYRDSEIYGIIITPRCDIENGKVLTFHYLPIVRLDDWLLHDYWIILRSLLIKNLDNTINQIFAKNNISQNLLELFEIESVRDKFEKKLKGIDQNNFLSSVNWLIEIRKTDGTISKELLEKIHMEKPFYKLGNIIFKDLTQNNRREFYLIEDWDGKDCHYVILLREIQKISWELGMKIAIGINNDDLDEEFFKKNDIKNIPGGFIFPFKVINSPFIEHLIQNFFVNFGRIGITDHENSLDSKLLQKYIIT